MPTPALPPLLLLLLAPGAAIPPAGELDGMVLTQLSIRQRIIIRVGPPLGRMPAVPVSRPPEPKMVEKKGPKCVPIVRLAGTGVARKDSVDLMLGDGTQMRARLGDDCPGLDFYAGLYLKPTVDGMLCADRDTIRARSGRACPISSFRKLKPKH